jgi:hypothetical protein
MSLGLRKNTLDFEIFPNSNTKTMIFVDASDYLDDNPERPLLEITPPGYAKYFLVNIVARRINILNASNIGLNVTLKTSHLTDLIDGVYTLKYKVCPYDKAYVQKYHLRTVLLECNLRKVYDFLADAECDIKGDDKLRQAIVDIMLLIALGKAQAEEGQVKKASDAYQKANKKTNQLIDKLEGRCNNVGLPCL